MSHGIKRGRHLNISLHLEYRDQLACFTIKDDGIGIAADVLSQINQGMPIQDGSRIHVGLYNTYKRLEKIYYGNAGMRISSVPDQGTSVLVWVPMTEDSKDSEGE